MYNCKCDDCVEQKLIFNLAISDQFKQLLNAGEKAFKQLHKKGSYSPEDLQNEKAYQDLIKKTFDVFDFAITDNDMPEQMTNALREDAYLFGSLKANAQLFEASKLLLDNDGKLKPFSELSKEFDRLNVSYNKNYLEAEYEFAVASSQMAAKWSELGTSDRYNLQYRTAKDERVRASHQALADITLPKEDPFWSSYYPPNGWRCRCTSVEVLKSKYETSDSDNSISAGEKATVEIGKDGKNRLEIFRFNAGQKRVVFPPTHPYNKVKGAKQVIKNETDKYKFIPENLDNYEKTLNVKIDKSFFGYLKKETSLVHKSRYSKGAYYETANNYVHIPFDDRRKRSSWYSQAIIYHEFGHAADWHNGFRTNKAVTSLMKDFKAKLSSDNRFIGVHKNLYEKLYKADEDNDWNTREQCGALADTLMSLDSNWGYGHSKSYFKEKGKSQAEFIAHMFENKFAGNPVFKDIAPELYDKMIELADRLKPKE